jgi:hypothetical protein
MCRVRAGAWPRAVIRDMLDRGVIASEKQAHRTLEKWCHKGWYDYGVAIDLGWLTHRAPPSSPTEVPPL